MLNHAVYKKDKGYIYKDDVNKDELRQLEDLFNYDEINEYETYTYFKLNSGRYAFVKCFNIEEENIFHAIVFEKINTSLLQIINEGIFINEIEEIDNLKRELIGEFNNEIAEEFLKSRQDRSIRDIIYFFY
ncbi:hypothetical protein [Thermobrachium celere]|uniref:hypothetical protein n=1 Tax=Thermobrachium celere TaxID=53422 RepID=UPI0019458B2C|nr:hypothetical protein [Thermobrachium celere]GFR35369.1 hypothetical protein TCEA9_11810 [Thermobrachium celere]